jgi:hypothetical protein
VDNAMIKALARAFRWRKLLETSVYGTIEDLAAAEKINSSYVSRVLRLTLLASDIIKAIFDGRHAPGLTLDTMKPFPILWNEQRRQ